MFFLRVLISFTVLMTVLLLAVTVHSAVNTWRILRHLRAVAHALSGQASQASLLAHPRLDGIYQGRRVSVFFQSGDGAGPRLTYLVVTLTARTGVSLLLLRTHFFKPSPDAARLHETAGEIVAIPETDGLYQVRSHDPGRARALCRQPAFHTPLQKLDQIVGLVLGPDRLIASAPYTDVAETDPHRLMRTIECLDAIAVVMEQTSSS